MNQKGKNKKRKVRLNAEIAGLATGIAFMAFCLFLLVLVTHDYQTARAYIIEGGPIPDDVFVIGGFVVFVSAVIGIPVGVVLWEAAFTKFGLLPRDEDAEEKYENHHMES